MFGTIRRHQGWLLAVSAAAVIGSLITFGPSGCQDIKLSGLNGGNGTFKIGDHTVTQDEIARAEREVILRYFLTTQQWPTDKSDFNVKREALIRLFLIEKEKQFGIKVGPESLAEYARHILGSARLDDFANQILKPAGLGEEDFEQFLIHEAGAQQLIAVAGLSGKLVTPGEAETMYRQEHQDIACSMILLSASNYMASVTVDTNALMQFYTNRMPVYREPARVQVNYVKFNVTNYLASSQKSLTNLDQQVDLIVKDAGTNLAGRAKTPEESRALIKDNIIRTNALAVARREASEFAKTLYDMTPRQPANIETLAAQKGLIVKTTEPFDETEGPKDLDVLYTFPKAAFKLTESEPFAGTVPDRDGVYVLGFKKLIPSMTPPFKAVEAKVTQDFRYNQGGAMAQQIAIKDYEALTNGLAHGKTFTALTAELGLKTESLPPFSLSTPKLPDSLEDRLSLNALRQAAFSTEVGGVSQPLRAQYGIFMIHVEKKLPIDETKLKAELPGFLAYMRQARQSDAFQQWFSVQIRQDPSFANVIQQASQETQPRPSPGTRRTK